MRGILRAQICGGGAVTLHHDVGTRSLDEVYVALHHTCRYAVVETPKGFEVWDLNTVTADQFGELMLRPPVSVYAELDAAVVAAAINYKDSG